MRGSAVTSASRRAPESPTVRVEVLADATALQAALLHEARAGLRERPRELSARWLYDARGSLLFEEITRLPEYYPTRREREILTRHAGDIARLAAADTLVELGSGSSEKTRLLLDALQEAGTLLRYVPFDLSETMLRASARLLTSDYPALQIHAVVGDFERHLPDLPGGGRRLLAFLGGTIGNLKPAARAAFLSQVAAGMGPGDTFLLGCDLLKDRARLHAAYNDAAGVTAAFNLNVLGVLNRELGADFAPHRFEHQACFDETHRWMEMRLVSTCAQEVTVAALGLSLTFEAGEALRTEVSAKFSLGDVREELRAAGLAQLDQWVDPRGDFAVTLAHRP
jgi:L-histidine N-alpha-methyltransferase